MKVVAVRIHSQQHRNMSEVRMGIDDQDLLALPLGQKRAEVDGDRRGPRSSADTEKRKDPARSGRSAKRSCQPACAQFSQAGRKRAGLDGLREVLAATRSEEHTSELQSRGHL